MSEPTKKQIESATKSWDGIDTQEFMDEMRREGDNQIEQLEIECDKLRKTEVRLRQYLEVYKIAVDAIYNHNEAARSAVVQQLGLYHPGLHHNNSWLNPQENGGIVGIALIDENAELVELIKRIARREHGDGQADHQAQRWLKERGYK